MQQLARWHIWLGWLIGVPILMWTLSGLVMVVQPIETVRGDDLRAEAGPINTAGLMLPPRMGPVLDVKLTNQVDGPVWIVTEPDGGRYRYSARDGTLVPPVIESEAQRIALAAYAGEAELETVRYFPGDVAPMDLRTPVASWQAHFSDGTNFYIDSRTGELLAVRTGWWRVYDFMWGLHIMDLQTREDSSHPILILFAALSAFGALIGIVLLFRRRRSRVR
jgi:uncharacterized iron-regulated membrane protein